MPLFPPSHFFTCGPFADSLQKVEDFAYNIITFQYFEETIRQQQIIEQKYIQAIIDGDEELADEMKQQLNTCEGAFRITATLLNHETLVS
jgi:hypothetical protein